MKKSILLITICAMTVLIVMASIQSLNPNRDKMIQTEFDTEDALKKLEPMVVESHPSGSLAIEKVKDYLLLTIKEMGYMPQVQETYRDDGVLVKNVIVKVPGREPGSALAVCAHYDSVSAGPGASDDGFNVAAMLEMIESMEGKSYKNDVIFIFSDSEENMFEGMKAFRAEHPFFDEIDFVINFEARGTAGTSLMFETTPNNINTIKSFNEATSGIVATSIMEDIYKVMDNGTDYHIFKEENIQGLNFAIVAEGHNYHTINDSIENISMNSFSIQGNHLYNLTTFYADYDLKSLYQKGNANFFDLFGRVFIFYPMWLAMLIKVLAIFVGILASYMIYKKLKMEKKEIKRVPLIQLAGMTIIMLLMPLLQKAYYLFGSNVGELVTDKTYKDTPLFISVLLLSIMAITIFYMWLMKKKSMEQIVMATLIMWISMSFIAGFIIRGGSYLFDWPLLFTGLTTIVWIKLRKRRDNIYNILFYIPFVVGLILQFTIINLFADLFYLQGYYIVIPFVFMTSSLFLPQLLSVVKRKWVLIGIELCLVIGFALGHILA